MVAVAVLSVWGEVERYAETVAAVSRGQEDQTAEQATGVRLPILALLNQAEIHSIEKAPIG